MLGDHAVTSLLAVAVAVAVTVKLLANAASVISLHASRLRVATLGKKEPSCAIVVDEAPERLQPEHPAGSLEIYTPEETAGRKTAREG